jgi:hypothetical protein
MQVKEHMLMSKSITHLFPAGCPAMATKLRGSGPMGYIDLAMGSIK